MQKTMSNAAVAAQAAATLQAACIQAAATALAARGPSNPPTADEIVNLSREIYQKTQKKP